MKAAILGATGYTGQLLLRLLTQHPEITDIIPASSSQAGKPLKEFDYGAVTVSVLKKTEITEGCYVSSDEAAALKPDVVFAALPHLKSADICAPFFENTVVIDLSADFRIADPVLFEKAYGQKPPREDLLKQAVYGLCEWQKDNIKTAQLIANPGCYPTATLLPLLPFAKEGLIKGHIVVNALSGVSGAGRKAKEAYLYTERTENVCAYSPGKQHRHVTEIEKELNHEILFTPHLVPMKRGMHITTTLETTKPLKESEVQAVFDKYYKGSAFVQVLSGHLPESREVRASNSCRISYHVEGKHLILCSVIDNLMKGASGQAVQNMNIRFGFPEETGLNSWGEV